MPILVDTYNVLHVVGVLPPEIAGVDTAGLVELIRASRFRHERVTLVCDGTPAPGAPTGSAGSVTIRYAGGGVTADELIARTIRRSSSPRRLTVVSTDREVARAARRRRCPTMRSEAFLRLIALDHRDAADRTIATGRRRISTGSLSDQQVASWLAVFDIADADDVEAFLPPEPEAAADAEPGTETEPEPQPAAPDPPEVSKPRPPVFPMDLVAEAARMVEEAVAEEIEHADAEALPPEETPVEETPAEPVAPSKADVATALASFFPSELLDDAESIARGDAPEPKTPDPPRERKESPAETESPRAQPRDAILSDDLIAEAEAMLRAFDDDSEQEEV